MKIVPVILSGGSGTRLWPLSREQYPKQLLTLVGEHSMLQATALRLKVELSSLSAQTKLMPSGYTEMAFIEDKTVLAPILVGNEEYRFLLAEQMRQIGISGFPLILEPCGRNTAPALTLAALTAELDDPEAIMVVMPADHVIQGEQAFLEAVRLGVELAETGKLVTFGIQPTAPETGYGYIRVGRSLTDHAFQVAQFVEKPNRSTAEHYLASGEFLWNSGIFAIKTSVWLSKIRQCRADIADAALQAFNLRTQDNDFIRPDSGYFRACPSESIDYAVMEKLAAENGEVAVVPLAADWSDVGSWDALWEIGEKDRQGNVLIGDVITVDSSDTLMLSTKRLVTCVGLNGLVVVETPDAILVADKTHIQKIKDVVAQIKAVGRTETDAHRKINRPWGWYDCIDDGDRFQVKRIMVNPGASLSLQLHHHRAEHWVVVRGTARVTRGDEVFLVSENQSTFIPLGTIHRLENPGKLTLEMIEVQSGAYLSEDDIVRYQDDYGRNL
ncbi:mannose-1-phosphate guanylyltransferase/mannose-6-phosphate isomerase [Candidatus Methylobacter oryzae]|uniref:mannose-1-phosphate guanylyltransferase n=1 Tax=Candidatus Methylobacter oryzae TaxID=2497749 RepID=A0ABY3C748_9GAMM|nr:mannose-1-phosphate guanylyltransferase/mannose-6-phosphate isomerase [Candidatus Methylobacter oryzae]TRW91463.1 mannose-1-phosphate guanylyltransferase/mannose-6-phosphate isomerase [Candidatus Methylobacter oryzae]